MQRSIRTGSAATFLSLAFAAPLLAAPAPDPATAPPLTITAAAGSAPCAGDIRAFSAQMAKDGYWAGGTDYGYGYPVGGYGYEGGYATDGTVVDGTGYARMRPGYEVRNLITAANILARNGQQAACESVLGSTRDIYQKYAAEIDSRKSWREEGPDWQQRQIANAQPVTDRTAAFRSGQLLDTEVFSAHDVGLGSVHDLVISPKTGKIAYLIIGRGGIFGFDATYVPVPWADFKVTANVNLLVLDTTKAGMDGAPAMTDAQLVGRGDFAAQSAKVDEYWKTALAAKTAD